MGLSGMDGLRIGVDIGGTFTDIVVQSADGRMITRKVSSSVDDYARAIGEGLSELFGETRFSPEEVREVRHGTTVASNAILEHKGARAGLITTQGFRDVLEIRNLRMPRLYDMGWTKPAPLVERHLRLTVDERLDFEGRVLRPLDPAEAERVVQALLDQGVETIAVCLLHAYANPAHERLIGGIIERLAPDIPVSLSSAVLPEIKEYERTSSTVINAYVMPVVRRYLRHLEDDLAARGMRAPLLLMQSNGGLMSANAAAGKPMHIIESGPAAGVVGAAVLAARSDLADVITLDMGGTTAKAAMIENGTFARALEYQVGGGIMAGSRLLTGAGYLLKVPAIDLAEVGAGGGSLVRLDAAGALVVGPESAGASPGPVCYDTGGTEPTVTDANLILGYLNPEHLVGGELRLNADRARAVFEDVIAGPMGLTLEQAAHGAHRIAAATMIRAIRAVSIERGRDPRGYTLCAFGGNGPVFAVQMARELGMRRVLVPPSPGVFSALGLLAAGVEHHHGQTFRRLLRTLDPAVLDTAFQGVEAVVRAELERDGFAEPTIAIERAASLHYQGQSFDLTVPVADGGLDETALHALEEAFGREHEATYGHRAGPDEPVELTEIRVVGRGLAREQPAPVWSPEAGAVEVLPSRAAYFGAAEGWLTTPVLRRAGLGEAPTEGPCIIEEYDATTLVPPGATARLDPAGNIVLEL